ncbi:MAG: hypothetical protein KGN79_04885 [Acidobacteriota bacterium]|nr:hypothetical protein [Acidobacteriota bacterium]
MAATKSQGNAFGIFMVGITTACAGLAFSASGGGKLALVVGAVLMLISLGLFIKIKPEEGKVPSAIQPIALKLIGIVCAAGGWLVVLYGLHLTSSVSGRFATTLVGFAISLVGALYFLPAAANKNAIWKA